MKTRTNLLLASLVFAWAPFLNASEGNADANTKGTIAAQAELSEKELLQAINARLERLESKVAALENDQRVQLSGLRSGVQAALNQIGEEIGSMQNSISQLKKATKALPPPAAEKPHSP